MIHSTALIDEGAKIGNNVRIWHWTHICSGAKIGENVSIGQNVYIANNVEIGSNCKIQNNVSIFDNVIIENDVFCGPSMVFTNVINPRAYIERKSEYLTTKVKKGATLGANCTIICGNVLGEYCFIGAGSVVTKDVKSFSLVVGNPSRQIGWISKYGEKLELPLKGLSDITCSHTGEVYKLNGNNLLCN